MPVMTSVAGRERVAQRRRLLLLTLSAAGSIGAVVLGITLGPRFGLGLFSAAVLLLLLLIRRG